jgi:two-component system chemotaxis sensor kinase CheA
MGSALINGATTLFINIYDIFQTLNPEWFAARAKPADPDKEKITLLIAEDSAFFRNQVSGFLKAENYSVLEAEDGVAALDILSRHHAEISLIITDIEMPKLDGLGLAEAIRGRSEYDRLPIIALTTLASEKDIARGKAAGINRYLIKMDKENLIATVHELLNAGK